MISRTLSPTRQAMKDGISKGKVDKVILVGGSTRVPAVQSAIEQEVGKAPFSVNPDDSRHGSSSSGWNNRWRFLCHGRPSFGCHALRLGMRL